MATRQIESDVRDFFSTRNVQAVGIASTIQHPSVPVEFSARVILEGARSFICYGVQIPKGILHAGSHALPLYWRYCNMSYRFLDTTSNQLCLLLEDKGYTSVPIYGCYPWKIVDGKFWGVMPLVYWAQQAGLGKLTNCGLLANAEYGTRILFGGVITTADLEPSKMMDWPGCPSACRECVDVCPVGAIGATGKVNHDTCIRASGANPLIAHLLRDSETKDKFDFETILNTVGVDDHGTYTCFKCLQVCPLNAISNDT
ncbi:MAG: 4Fe-4S double cluster binding domain-containing protein [Pseudomonadota bacterium]